MACAGRGRPSEAALRTCFDIPVESGPQAAKTVQVQAAAPNRTAPHRIASQRWRGQGPVSLQKQEQIQGPKNASIAWFDGLGCY